MIDTKEITFPALVFCLWNSNFNLEETVFECKFNSKPCQNAIEKVVIIGYGQSEIHNCIRVNGAGKYPLLTSRINTLVDSGLTISFLIPGEVSVLSYV
jgi:hypothetical protein